MRYDSMLSKRSSGVTAPHISAEPAFMSAPQTIPPLPELGHSESYYVRLAHRAERHADPLALHAAKVGQYITLAMDVKLTWEEKLRYLKHTLNKHCTPPRIADDSVWAFYKDLQKMVRDASGQEALRIACNEDDLYAQLAQSGKDRCEIEDRADVFFRRMICTDDCAEWFHEDDFAQLKMIRDQWV